MKLIFKSFVKLTIMKETVKFTPATRQFSLTIEYIIAPNKKYKKL